MDEIDTFKVKALDNMQKTIDALSSRARQVAVVPRPRRARSADSGGAPSDAAPTARLGELIARSSRCAALARAPCAALAAGRLCLAGLAGGVLGGTRPGAHAHASWPARSSRTSSRCCRTCSRRPASSSSSTYIGTLEGAEKIADGDTSDAAWFSHGKYLSLLPDAGQQDRGVSRRSCSARSSSA